MQNEREKQMNHHTVEMLQRLRSAGISNDDAIALRRAAMALHRWHERECGDADGNCIERDESTGIPYATYDLNSNGKRGRIRIPDRETGALKRIATILARYPGFAYYIQGDPRGAPLYILRPGDVPAGAEIAACYNRGIAVHA
jgi:hypothetical protein